MTPKTTKLKIERPETSEKDNPADVPRLVEWDLRIYDSAEGISQREEAGEPPP